MHNTDYNNSGSYKSFHPFLKFTIFVYYEQAEGCA